MSSIHLAHKRNRRKGTAGQRWQLAILALGILLFAAACSSTGRGTPPSAASSNDPSIGPADAPVTIVEYGDFG